MSLPCGDRTGRTPATPRLRVEERHGRRCQDVERIRETGPPKTTWELGVTMTPSRGEISSQVQEGPSQCRGRGCDDEGWTDSAGLGKSAVGWVDGV